MFDHSLHLQHFNNGCSRIQGVEGFKQYTQKNGYAGWGPSANDPNGSCYWISQSDMDDIWKYHDSNIADHELGWNPKNGTHNKSFNRIDCDSPPNKRIASGKEPGANEFFTGNSVDSNGNTYIDPEKYNGRISGGLKECVSDKTSLDDCSVKGPRKFNDPNELAQKQCKKADTISRINDGPEKDAAVQKWNTQAEQLDRRMAGEQDYLSRRSTGHQNRMNQFEPGSLEYNRAKDNKDWCDNYSKQLGESREALHNKYNELNNSNEKSNNSNDALNSNGKGKLPEQNSNSQTPQKPTNNSKGELPQQNQTPDTNQGNKAQLGGEQGGKYGTTPDQEDRAEMSQKPSFNSNGFDNSNQTELANNDHIQIFNGEDEHQGASIQALQGEGMGV